MRRRFFILAGIVLVSIVLITAIVQYFFGVPLTFLSKGSINVQAVSVSPSPNYERASEHQVSVSIYENGLKIGDSSQDVVLATGTHLISFGSFNDTYDTPTAQEIIVRHRQTSYIYVKYMASFGYLTVDTEKYDDYNETHTPFAAKIFVDEKLVGAGHASVLFQKEELGNHTVAFSADEADIAGYAVPPNMTVLVEQTKTTTRTVRFSRILTDEQREYCMLRRVARRDPGELKSDSTLINDVFYRWIMDNRIRVPMYLMDFQIGHNKSTGLSSPQTSYIGYYIAHYAGVTLEERIDSLETLYPNLMSLGINLTKQGGYLSYKGSTERIFHLEVGFRDIHSQMLEILSSTPITQLYCLNQQELSIVPVMFPNVIPAGFSLQVKTTKEVYLKEDTTLNEISVACPSLKEYEEHEGWGHAWYYDAWKGFSVDSLVNFYFADSVSQIQQIINAFSLGRILLSPNQFLSNLRWVE